MEVPVYNLAREVVKHIDVSDYVFAAPFNEAVVHQAMLQQRANARQGTADTKTRGEVAGTGRKMFRQKGTGEARAGMRRSPVRRGGGIVFGPEPRSYRQSMPRKMRQLAIRCLLSAKVKVGELLVVEQLQLGEPKTKEMARILAALKADASVLIATVEPEENVIKSARNLPGVKTTLAGLLNVLDLLSYKTVLLTEDAVRHVEQLWEKSPSQGGNGASL
ncbi:MAG: 50S ribosomal protein L4 [Dehalococcoidales bacterium]|nr:50S ribosomal protein L4 [Dehalococcoidales bacterium]